MKHTKKKIIFNIKNKYFWLLLLSFILIFSFIYASIDKYIRTSNLYNVGPYQDYKEKINKDALIIYDEYVMDIFEGQKLNVNSNILQPANIGIGQTSNIEANERAKKYDFNIEKNKNLDFNKTYNLLLSNSYDKIDLSYYDSLNIIDKYKSDFEQMTKSYAKNNSIVLQNTGYLLTSIDGYENLLNINNIKINGENIELPNDIEANLNGVKYVNNKYFYLLIKDLDKHLIGNLRNALSRIKIDNSEYLVESIYNYNNLSILKINEGLDKILGKRDIKVEIITNYNNLIKVPKSSVSYEHKQIGVYINENDIARFAPIRIIKEDEKYYYVSVDYNDIFSGFEQTKLKEYEDKYDKITLKEFSNIVKNAADIKDGDKL